MLKHYKEIFTLPKEFASFRSKLFKELFGSFLHNWYSGCSLKTAALHDYLVQGCTTQISWWAKLFRSNTFKGYFYNRSKSLLRIIFDFRLLNYYYQI